MTDPDSPDEPVIVPIEGEIDLHSFPPREVVAVVVEYLAAAHAAGFREVRLIHGRGQGVQRALVQRALRDHPLVASIWDDTASHLGATFARLIP
jgi:DNA-nicking Smr family endonuclease